MAQVLAGRAVIQVVGGIARNARIEFLLPHRSLCICMQHGKAATQVSAIFAANVAMTAV
jgi:hypothetical protein